jgi:enoyl-CoA hydratase
MGMPGVEFFAHPWEMGPRFAKEFLYIGEPINAARALELGMVNRVVPGPQLLNLTLELAAKVATRSAMALALAKKSVNVAQDHMGMRDGIEHAFALHQLAHAHNREQTGDDIAGLTAREMKRSMPD